MSERFYSNSQIGPGQIELGGSEAHHLAAVCRLTPGAQITLFCGDGFDYPAKILEVGKNRTLLQVGVGLAINREAPILVTVAAPLPKSDRADFLIEKLTEMGVSRFIPLETDRSFIRARKINHEKLQRQVIEASKQCERNVLMKIAEPCSLANAIDLMESLEKKLFAQSRLGNCSNFYSREAMGIGFLIGPEGGFTQREIELAMERNWRPISLGKRILRVETAAILAAGLAIAPMEND